jgi:hypothetical protein
VVENIETKTKGRVIEIEKDGVKLKYKDGNTAIVNKVDNLKIAEKSKFDIGNEVNYINQKGNEIS